MRATASAGSTLALDAFHDAHGRRTPTRKSPVDKHHIHKPWHLTRRDREIVRWIGRHGAVQAQHVMTRFSIGRTAAYRRLHELVEQKIVSDGADLGAYGRYERRRAVYGDSAMLMQRGLPHAPRSVPR